MNRPVRVASVEHLGARVLRLVFTDDVVRELDFADALPGLLAAVDDDDVFPTVSVDPVAGTLSWPGGVDLDPDVLRGRGLATEGARARLVAEYRLQQTS